ncbi:hypothetical protein, partial [Dapis sp. BLCC M229]|uniref:hypothetical protein n=1 Tax=Dapis sp. BLCC M229 TaxID=3400188 RepID=UPI003CF04EB6
MSSNQYNSKATKNTKQLEVIAVFINRENRDLKALMLRTEDRIFLVNMRENCSNYPTATQDEKIVSTQYDGVGNDYNCQEQL